MARITKPAILAVVLCLVSGCSATTTLSAVQGNTTVRVKESSSTEMPRTQSFSTTSFGNYEFRAESPGLEPLTGILPLKFNGGYLAADILFFAPAMFFNLREVFAFYEFDLVAGVVRYKQKPDDPWMEHAPSSAEKARGQDFFGNK